MGAYLKSWHRAEDGPCVRCYVWRLVEAMVVGLLLAALALAWSQQHLPLRSNGSADSGVLEPVSEPARDARCPGYGFEAMETDHHGGAVVTPC